MLFTIQQRLCIACLICVICSIDCFLLSGRFRKQPAIRSVIVNEQQDEERTVVAIKESFEEDTISKFIKGCINSSSCSDQNSERVRTTAHMGKQLLQSLKLPHRKDEAWRHTNLKKLFSHEFQPTPQPPLAQIDQVNNQVASLIDAHCTKSCIVFIDGVYSAQHSCIDNIPAQVIARSIRNIHDATILQRINSITQWVPDLDEHPRNSFGSDFLTALNKAGLSDAACIVVPEGVPVEVPVQVLFCNTATQTASGTADNDSGAAGDAQAITKTSAGTIISDSINVMDTQPAHVSYPSLVVLLGDGAVLRLKQSYHTIVASPCSADGTAPSGSAVPHIPHITSSADNSSNGSNELGPQQESAPGMVAAGTSIWLGEGAALTHTYVQDVADNIRHLEVVTANLSQRNSRYDATVLQCGGKVSRVNVHVNIVAETSNCTLDGITLAGTGQSLDLHSSILHNSTAGISRQQQRNVIADKGEAIFKGRIRIPKQAQLTDSDQLCRSIMLGSRARLQVMPTLEISADNVVCSHGASVVDLDENSMFYLASRGIDRREARKLLLMGFVFDLLKGHIMDERGARRIVAKVQSLYPHKETARAEDAPSAQKYLSI